MCPIALNCDRGTADIESVDLNREHLKSMIDGELYVVDGRAVADAILVRGYVRGIVPGASFRSDLRAPETAEQPASGDTADGGAGPAGSAHHQTVESRFSISSNGRV